MSINSIIKCFFVAIIFSNAAISQCVNVALNKPATATGTYLAFTPNKAFDGDCGTGWNAAKFPTASIQVDLQQSYSIERIVFIPSVSPTGNETYKIYTTTNMSTWTVVDTFTINVAVTGGQIIARSYSASPLTNVRGVKIECIKGPSWTSIMEIGVYQLQTSNNATITPSGIITICNVDSVLLSASNGTQYKWSNGKTTQNIYAKQGGTYNVVVSSSSDCLNTCSDTAYVTVNVDTLNARIVSPLAICQKDSVTLSASGGIHYLWNTQDTTFSITVSPGSSKIYSVIVSDSSCNDSAAVAITVNPLPDAHINGNTIIYFGESTTLTASGGGHICGVTEQQMFPLPLLLLLQRYIVWR